MSAPPGIWDLDDRAERLAKRLRSAGHLVTLGNAVTETTAAELIGVKPRTLRRWRAEEHGPRTYTAGRVWYPLTEIIGFIEKSLAASGRARS